MALVRDTHDAESFRGETSDPDGTLLAAALVLSFCPSADYGVMMKAPLCSSTHGREPIPAAVVKEFDRTASLRAEELTRHETIAVWLRRIARQCREQHA